MVGHKTRFGNRRVDSAAVLEILAYIERNPGVVSRDLQRMLGLSRATVSRVLQDIREQYGVKLTWDPTLKEYRIDDWGVFDAEKVLDRIPPIQPPFSCRVRACRIVCD